MIQAKTNFHSQTKIPLTLMHANHSISHCSYTANTVIIDNSPEVLQYPMKIWLLFSASQKALSVSSPHFKNRLRCRSQKQVTTFQPIPARNVFINQVVLQLKRCNDYLQEEFWVALNARTSQSFYWDYWGKNNNKIQLTLTRILLNFTLYAKSWSWKLLFVNTHHFHIPSHHIDYIFCFRSTVLPWRTRVF